MDLLGWRAVVCVRVVVRVAVDAGLARLEVGDNGSGVPVAVRPRVAGQSERVAMTPTMSSSPHSTKAVFMYGPVTPSPRPLIGCAMGEYGEITRSKSW